MTSQNMQEGATVKLSITRQGVEHGLAEYEGYVFLVKGASKGTEYNVKITRLLTKVAFAEIVPNVTDQPNEKPD